MKTSFAVPSIALLCCALAAFDAAAQPGVKSLYPAGGQVGSTFELSANGAFPNWPVEVEVLGDSVKIECGEKKGKFKVSVDKQAAPGPRWLRFYDAAGVDAWRCFLIDQTKEQLEVEPNDLVKDERIELPRIINGKLQKREDVDAFAFELKEGQTLVASLDAKRWLKSSIDCVLQVCDERGFVLAQNDDSRGLDPLLVFTAPRTATYQVRVFGFPETPNSSIQFYGGADLVYRLTLSTDGVLDYVLPLSWPAQSPSEPLGVSLRGWNLPADILAAEKLYESHVAWSAPKVSGFGVAPIVDMANLIADADSSESKPQQISAPVAISGEIESPGDVDAYRLTVKKGQRIHVAIQASELGQALDPILIVKTADGKVLKEQDDPSRSQRDPAFTIKAPADGSLDILVRDSHQFGGPRHAYRLRVEEEAPGVRLTAPASVVVQREKDVEISIAVERIAGWNEEIQLAIEGLPNGVACDAVKIDAKAKTAKLKLVAEKAAQLGAATIRVVAEGGDRKFTASYPLEPIRLSRILLLVK